MLTATSPERLSVLIRRGDRIAVEMPRAESTYDALQVSYNHRMAHGMILNVNYTYSHALDDMPGGIFGGYQDDKNPMLDYGNGDIDIRHQLELDYVYSLPSVPHVPKVLGGGWQMNGIYHHAGRPALQHLVQLRSLQLWVE